MRVHLVPLYLQIIATPFLEKRRNSKFDLFPRSPEVDTRDIVVPVTIVQEIYRDVVEYLIDSVCPAYLQCRLLSFIQRTIDRRIWFIVHRLTEPTGNIHDGIGNYTADVKCSWLIESTPNTTIRLHVEQFATECGWDHMYIYDGDSVEAPLLAVFSGLMHKDGYHIRRVPEVIARSGSALLHFYSDVAYNMSGFNISYKINACPSRCATFYYQTFSYLIFPLFNPNVW